MQFFICIVKVKFKLYDIIVNCKEWIKYKVKCILWVYYNEVRICVLFEEVEVIQYELVLIYDSRFEQEISEIICICFCNGEVKGN